MHFPPPEEPAHHRWISIGAGILIGLVLLALILEQRRAPQRTEAWLPPQVAHQEPGPQHTLDSAEAAAWLVEAVIQVESQGDPTKVGGVGERGLMQIRESTWREVTERHFDATIPFARAFEPDLNRQVGRLYLGDLQRFLYRHQDQWKADLRSLLLASYNAGPERVRSAGFDLRRLPEVVQSYASRASALHDWYLGDHSEELREKLIEAGSSSAPR
jgi:hypothetical protein